MWWVTPRPSTPRWRSRRRRRGPARWSPSASSPPRRKPAMAISKAPRRWRVCPAPWRWSALSKSPTAPRREGYLAIGRILLEQRHVPVQRPRLPRGDGAAGAGHAGLLPRRASTHAHRDMDFIRLGEAAFLACPSQSIDYAVMEHAANAAVVPVDMGWNDVGSWQSLWDISPRDADGNAILGDVVTEKSAQFLYPQRRPAGGRGGHRGPGGGGHQGCGAGQPPRRHPGREEDRRTAGSAGRRPAYPSCAGAPALGLL